MADAQVPQPGGLRLQAVGQLERPGEGAKSMG